MSEAKFLIAIFATNTLLLTLIRLVLIINNKHKFALAAFGRTRLMLGGGALFTLTDLATRTQNDWAEFHGNKVIA